jgi:hypothetical protein
MSIHDKTRDILEVQELELAGEDACSAKLLAMSRD